LVVPNRVVPRLSDLTPEEVTDLFGSVQTIGAGVEKAYGAQALTVACQDGPAAGQSVPHVHVHILPRKWVDFNGNNDEVYPALEENEFTLPADLGNAYTKVKPPREELKMDNDAREPRSTEEMEKEAAWLTTLFPDHQSR